jgi:hypothetical protein
MLYERGRAAAWRRQAPRVDQRAPAARKLQASCVTMSPEAGVQIIQRRLIEEPLDVVL